MTAEIHQFAVDSRPGRMATPRLRTLVVCDIADSTALVERMGDQSAAGVIRKHDRLARALVEQHGGREIDKTDGFLLLFERPIQATAFALDYQRGLKHMSAAEGVVVRARVGIHMGDVVIWENAPEDVARGAKPIEVEGLVKPVAARLAQLAAPQQILMSSAVAGIARRAAGELGAETAQRVQWREHGRYRFKGLPDPMAVVEVGEGGLAPLHAPRSARTARRILPWWRRPLTLAAEAAMLLIGIGVGAWFLLQSPPTLAFAERDWVVVGDLQNHTNQNQLAAPLDAAFKIGLEQSQYVNVIPNIQVQDALKRMEKPPDTSVNRTVGSDIAMREGARALILPSLAQIGGAIQISAEVIDPHTGVTVYSDSAQADSEKQILPATDKLLKSLRGRLGESLGSIQKTSMPLQQITTSNMDALQAYAKAEDAIGRGDLKQGFLLLREAVHLDPAFALALARLGSLQLGYQNDPAAAFASFQAASKHPERLSVRERLGIQGALGLFGDVQKALDAWTTMVHLYPSSAAAQQNIGMVLYSYRHMLAEALPHFLAAANSRHPLRGISWFNAAMVDTELGKYADADAAVAQGRKLGAMTPHLEDVTTDLAQRRYRAVVGRLDAMASRLPPSMQAERQLRMAAVAVDQSRDGTAREALAAAAKDATAAGSKSQQARVALARAALDLSAGKADAPRELAGLVESEIERISGPGVVLQGDDAAVVLSLAAMLAARHDDPALARKALDASRGFALDRGYYDAAALWRTADCETRFATDVGQRASCLAGLVDGREYFQTHVALRLAYLQAGNTQAADREAAWMRQHRGQAVAELPVQPALVFNLLALRRVETAGAERPPVEHKPPASATSR